jgi:excisionase family DNA binding protein
MTELKTEGWLTTVEAKALTGYGPTYLRRLAKRGDVEAHKVGRDWLIWRESLLAHKDRMDSLGRAKHNPWRDDLVKHGRGRAGG